MKRLIILAILALFIVACTPKSEEPAQQTTVLEKVKQRQIENAQSDFERFCYETSGMWMSMAPMRNGKLLEKKEECVGCMPDPGNHICDEQEYRDFVAGKI